METLLQHRATALIARLQTASTGGHRLAGANPWIGTTICTGNGRKADHALTLKLDHLIGAGHSTDAGE